MGLFRGGFSQRAYTGPGPLASGIKFRSDWSTALGTSAAAKQDSGQAVPWGDLVDSGNRLSVVATASLGGGAAPFANCLATRLGTPAPGSGHVAVTGLWPSPQVGDVRFWRTYLRNDIADSEGDFTSVIASAHPLESTYPSSGGSTEEYEFQFTSDTTGKFPWKFAPNNAAFPKNRWMPGNAGPVWAKLNKFVWYRFEWKLTKTATNTYTLDMRISDGAPGGGLLYDANTIYDAGLPTNPAAQTLAATGTGIQMADTELTGFRLGNSGGPWGSAPGPLATDEFFYWGGVMVRDDTWPGAY